MAGETATGPLAGLRVLDMTSVLLGPYATQIMGDMGADVIKVESLEGDVTRNVTPFRTPGMGAVFMNVNRNKRSLAIDLKNPAAREAFLKLVPEADVLVCSIRPGAMRRLGLSYEDLKPLNPGLIYCGAYGFSENGPYAGRPAYDDIIQAACGLADLHERSDGAPAYSRTVLADKVTGLMCLSAVTMALVARGRTGKGQFVEVPMFESLVAFMHVEHLQGASFEPPLGRTGYDRVLAPHRKPYRTSDGHVALLPYTTRHWIAFLDAIGRSDITSESWVTDPANRSRHIGRLYEIVSEATPGRSTAAWLALFAEIDVPAMPVMGTEALLQDPHLDEIGFWPLFQHLSEGEIRLVGQPIRFDSTPASYRLGAPKLGEHSLQILAEVGIAQGKIDDLLQSGGVKQSP
ncbi:CoA transferase [Nisaea sp.]|uniref:CaiB/BaiF CoA transferase family protein n=1 Tax=Nisaea sp. TaxID=2024842 RepID=UPI00329A2910